MKKSYFVLLLVLMIISVFALVACDKTTETPQKGSESDDALQATEIVLNDEFVFSKVYDGKAVNIEVNDAFTTDSTGAITVSWYKGSELLSSAPKNAGTYKFVIEVAETSTHKEARTEGFYVIEKKTLNFLDLETSDTWEEHGSTEVTLTVADGIIAGDVVKVTISNGNYQTWGVGDCFNLRNDETGAQGDESVYFVEDGDYANYAFNYDASGFVGTITIVKVSAKVLLNDEYEFSKAYDGNGVTLDAYDAFTTDSTGAITVSWYKGSELLSGEPKNAGTYKFVIEVAETSTHKEARTEGLYVIEKKALNFLDLDTSDTWEEHGSTEVTLTVADGIIAGDVVKVTISNGNYQDWDIGECFNLRNDETGVQGDESVYFVEDGDYGNYKFSYDEDGYVGTITIVS